MRDLANFGEHPFYEVGCIKVRSGAEVVCIRTLAPQDPNRQHRRSREE